MFQPVVITAALILMLGASALERLVPVPTISTPHVVVYATCRADKSNYQYRRSIKDGTHTLLKQHFQCQEA